MQSKDLAVFLVLRRVRDLWLSLPSLCKVLLGLHLLGKFGASHDKFDRLL